MLEAAAPQTPMEAWLVEWRRLAKTMAWDGKIALDRLEHCRSPMDLAQVQQDWFLAWLTASMDCGLRVLGASGETPAPPAASEDVFHLPD